MFPFSLRAQVTNVTPWVPDADAATLSWAETMVRSRALTFESGWKGTELMCMVPFVDLANHRVPLPDEVPCFPVDLVRDPGAECVASTPATDSISTILKAGETVCHVHTFFAANKTMYRKLEGMQPP